MNAWFAASETVLALVTRFSLPQAVARNHGELVIAAPAGVSVPAIGKVAIACASDRRALLNHARAGYPWLCFQVVEAQNDLAAGNLVIAGKAACCLTSKTFADAHGLDTLFGFGRVGSLG